MQRGRQMEVTARLFFDHLSGDVRSLGRVLREGDAQGFASLAAAHKETVEKYRDKFVAIRRGYVDAILGSYFTELERYVSPTARVRAFQTLLDALEPVGMFVCSTLMKMYVHNGTERQLCSIIGTGRVYAYLLTRMELPDWCIKVVLANTAELVGVGGKTWIPHRVAAGLYDWLPELASYGFWIPPFESADHAYSEFGRFPVHRHSCIRRLRVSPALPRCAMLVIIRNYGGFDQIRDYGVVDNSEPSNTIDELIVCGRLLDSESESDLAPGLAFEPSNAVDELYAGRLLNSEDSELDFEPGLDPELDPGLDPGLDSELYFEPEPDSVPEPDLDSEFFWMLSESERRLQADEIDTVEWLAAILLGSPSLREYACMHELSEFPALDYGAAKALRRVVAAFRQDPPASVRPECRVLPRLVENWIFGVVEAGIQYVDMAPPETV